MQKKIKVYVEKGAKIPTYAHPDDACFDIYGNNKKVINIHPGEVYKMPTGLYMEPPRGHFIEIRPRSSKGAMGLTVANSPGVVDEGFRGEIMVLLLNASADTIQLDPEERIAQGMLREYEQVVFQKVDKKDKLKPTKRGDGGFGSSGK